MGEATVQDKFLDLTRFSETDRNSIFSFAEFLQSRDLSAGNDNYVTKEESDLIDEALQEIKDGKGLSLKDVFFEKQFAHLI